MLLSLTLAGCVKIETGQTVDEAVESAEQRASRARATWANKFRSASPVQMTQYVAEHFDQTTDMFFRFGRRMIDQWRQGSEGRGVEVKASVMREMIDAWTTAEKPLLVAFEDNLEYGVDQIRQSGFFDERLLRQMGDLVDVYYDVYSAVMYPVGSIEDYDYLLDKKQREAKQASRQFREALESF